MSVLFPKLQEVGEIQLGFSNRKDGSMHRHLEKENRNAYFQRIGIDPERVVAADLVHGDNVCVATSESAGKMIANTDSLITNQKDLFLSITAADCFLIYFYDPTKKVNALVHAGWRGTLGNIVGKTVENMVERFETAPSDFLVGIGPGIQRCHFEISHSDKEKYDSYRGHILERDKKAFVDLAGILKEQLIAAGASKENIEDSQLCTYCETDNYFSYRRDKPQEVQPMVGYIGLR